VAFSIVYFLVAQGIRERSDTWLSGEAEVLAQVSADTPSDHLYRCHNFVATGPHAPSGIAKTGKFVYSVSLLSVFPNGYS
jgi:hypothetical protein